MSYTEKIASSCGFVCVLSFGTKSTKNAYLYGENQPGAPVKVGDTDYKYDASGNPVSMRGGDSDRTLRYDAENRLRVIEDTHNGTMSLYTYNHTGERSLKRYGAFNTAYLNGAYAGSGLDGLTRYCAYISPYYVEHGTGTNSSTATKHYYIGTERLVSKLVTESGGKEDQSTDEDTYYYFTDHLGSTTHITDKGGKVVQYAAYTPYGTLFREYKSVMPYKFNGKELDQETGYYYYGARYYDPTTALWLGVDPLQYKYSEVSPYVYCAGNPVKYVDPDGREIDMSSLNEEDKKSFLSSMEQAKQNSPLFNSVFSALDNSKDTYSIRIGNTIEISGEKVLGQYDESNKTITFLSSHDMLKPDVYVEEFFHAYQFGENHSLYSSVDFNFEFEAKVAKIFILQEMDSEIPYIPGMEEYQYNLYNKYDYQPPTCEEINSASFLSNYNEAANKYSLYYKNTNYGGNNYKIETKQDPHSLHRMCR